MLKIGNKLEIDIEKIVFGGESLGYHEGFAVFVPMGVPGDRVEIEIISLKKSYGRGLITKLIKASSDRIDNHNMISFEDFNGCDFGMLRYNKQVFYKTEMTKDVLGKIGGLNEYELFDTLGAENPYNYRNKIIEPFSKVNGQIITGFFKKKSHEVFEANDNWLQDKEMEEILKYLKIELNKSNVWTVYDEKTHKGLLRHIMLRKNSVNELMFVLVINGKVNDKLKELVLNIADQFKNIKSAYISINNQKTNVALGRENILIFGKKYLKEELFDIYFNISPTSFFQINKEQTIKLYAKAMEFFDNIENKTIVDAYSGTGTIAMLLSNKAKKIYGIESVESATRDAKKTAKENKISNIEFINGKMEIELEKLIKKGTEIDGIIFDPPRKGIDEKILKEVAKQGIKDIVYVSCNPSTFARDMKILSGFGYKLIKVQPVDMFPQTNHIELVGKIMLMEEKC